MDGQGVGAGLSSRVAGVRIGSRGAGIEAIRYTASGSEDRVMGGGLMISNSKFGYSPTLLACRSSCSACGGRPGIMASRSPSEIEKVGQGPELSGVGINGKASISADIISSVHLTPQ